MAVEIIYGGVDITERVQVAAASALDASDGRCDSLDISFEDAATWQGWGPQKDDRIEVRQGVYSTGEMYINATATEDGTFRILATAAKTAAFQRGHESFQNITLAKLMEKCAGECGMGWKLYGISGNIQYPFLLRDGCAIATFLAELAKREGCVLKTYGGRFTMISIAAAQELDPTQTITISAEQRGVRYVDKSYAKAPSLRAVSPWAAARAWDSAQTNGKEITIGGANAHDAAAAGRMARGLLLHHNRQAESIAMSTELMPGWTAMARLNVEGNKLMNGEWIIDEIRHDLKGEKSDATLLRCITTIR